MAAGGLFRGSKPGDNAQSQQQAQHTAVISLTVRNTNKIVKEIGFRRSRLKTVFQKCNNAIKVLNEFKDVEWPISKTNNAKVDSDENEDPNPTTATVATDTDEDTTIATNGSDTHVKEEVEANDSNDNENESNDDDNASPENEVVGIKCALSAGIPNPKSMESVDMKNSSEEDIGGKDVADGDDEQSENDSMHGNNDGNHQNEEHDKEMTNGEHDEGVGIETVTSEEEIKHADSVLNDGMDAITTINDPVVEGLKNEQMHPAIKSALSSYCSVINNAQSTPKMVEIALECIGLLISNRYVVGSTIYETLPQQGGDEGEDSETKQTEILYLINCICERADHISDAVQIAISKALLALMTSPVCGVYEAGMLKAVRTVFHIYLVTKYDNVRQTSRAVLLDMLRSVFSRMEAYDAMTPNGDNASFVQKSGLTQSQSDETDQNTMFASRFHTDSYLLFRALCKLSSKLLPEDKDDSSIASNSRKNIFSSNAPVTDPMATHTKILSLELILAIFENCGTAFRNGEKFIYAVQNFLCVSLVKNSMSNNPRVAVLSLKVFLLLVYKFKQHLKAEIEVFVANVFLPALQSPNTPVQRKNLVLEALRSLCGDPVILTQIFLNYDCDFEAVDLYKKIVHHLTSLSVISRISSPNAPAGPENLFVSITSLQVLVAILQAFLKALKLPGGDDIFDDERSKVNLQLDVGLAAKAESEHIKQTDSQTDDMVVSANDIETMEKAVANNVDATTDAVKIVDAFDKKRLAQRNFETGTIKFRLSGKQGVLFFVKHGFLHLDAEELARFFLTHKEVLDKTQMGEIFGREPEASFVKEKGVDPEKGGVGFYIRVLHHYVDALDFAGIKFDDAIRLFLSGFRLPGESQKVDRIMEKFAERYTLQNEDIFPSADTAFILSFAVIMLQTDLHNPNIKPEKKLTAETFIHMNRGISVNGGDLPPEFLTDLFNSIKARPFTLKEDDDARESMKKSKEKENIAEAFFGGNSAEDRRRERFNKERAELLEASENLFKSNKRMTTPTHLTESICPSDVVKPMFDITWGPLIGALSQIMEKAEDDTSIKLCLNGFVYAVRIAAYNDIELAKDTFVTSLAKFTALGSAAEMKTSNIESIRTILSIAIMDGEMLGDSWRPILQCISQLGRLQFFASGVDDVDDYFLNSAKTKDKKQQRDQKGETEEFNSKAVLEAINEILIEKVFTASTKLSDSAILNFVKCTVLVSKSEIEGDSKKDISGVGRSKHLDGSGKNVKESGDGPRIYSLQKLVEIADYNMNVRSRLSWAKIWDLMAEYLVAIGCHENAMVSMFAVDALRQLSFKFLEKPELADFNFQRTFLRPFLLIMKNPGTREDTRELILQCVDNSIRSISQNIRSGWKIFFLILGLSANDSSENVSSFGLSIIQRLLDKHFDQLCTMNSEDENLEYESSEEKIDHDISALEAKERNRHAEDFIGLCRASVAFIECETTHPISVSMRAMCHVAVYADHIAEGKILPPVSTTQSDDIAASGYTYEGLSDDEAKEMCLWRPLLDGLASGISSNKFGGSSSDGVGCIVQRGSTITLRAILLRHGHRFSANQWSVIMNQVILPSMQVAIENDTTSVTKIISESPIVSNLDFFPEPLPLPPSSADEGLLKFAVAAQSVQSAPTRQYGEAELLVEASFADLRHGGDGDLTKAHGLLQKVVSGETFNHEEPFPDSWVATTGPIALGMLTDIFCMIIMRYSVDDARKMWPIIMGQMQRWAVGCPVITEIDSSSLRSSVDTWAPCEALVRIGCAEISRLSETLIVLLPRMQKSDERLWLNVLCKNLADTLIYSIELESKLHEEFKQQESQIEESLASTGNDEEPILTSEDEPEPKYRSVITPYGQGQVTGNRVDDYPLASVNIDIIELASGATLYGPKIISEDMQTSQSEDLMAKTKEPGKENQEVDVTLENSNAVLEEDSPLSPIFRSLNQYISPLRVRCTASCCLQKSLTDYLELFSVNCGKEEISLLSKALEKSRVVSSKACVDKDLSSSFEDAILMEWGDQVEEPNKAFSSDGGVGHLRRSEMFFLTQEASANDILVHFLSLLYCPRNECVNEWDTVTFAEPLLMERISDVLQRFIDSEREDGHRIDPNVWRAASESGGTLAVPCTSFAAVVVNILNKMLAFSDSQFEKQKGRIFPILCSLITVHSSEIRSCVANVMNRKVSVLLGI